MTLVPDTLHNNIFKEETLNPIMPKKVCGIVVENELHEVLKKRVGRVTYINSQHSLHSIHVVQTVNYLSNHCVKSRA